MQTPERNQEVNNAIRRELGMPELHETASNGAGVEMGTGQGFTDGQNFFMMLDEDFKKKHNK